MAKTAKKAAPKKGAAKAKAPAKKASKPRREHPIVTIEKNGVKYKAAHLGEVLDKRVDAVYNRYKVIEGKEEGKIIHLKKDPVGRGNAGGAKKKVAKKAAPKKKATKKSAAKKKAAEEAAAEL